MSRPVFSPLDLMTLFLEITGKRFRDVSDDHGFINLFWPGCRIEGFVSAKRYTASLRGRIVQ